MVLLLGNASAQTSWNHELITDAPDVPWKITGPLRPVSPPVHEGVGSTTLTLQRGLYLVELEGGSVYRGNVLLAQGVVTTRIEESSEINDFPRPVTEPVLLQVGMTRSLVHVGSDDYRLECMAFALGVGNSSGIVNVAHTASSYTWTVRTEVFYPIGGGGREGFHMNLLPGQTYLVEGSASGNPVSEPLAHFVAAEAIAEPEREPGTKAKDLFAPHPGIAHAIGIASATYSAPEGGWSYGITAGGYYGAYYSFGPVYAVGPRLPLIDPVESMWLLY